MCIYIIYTCTRRSSTEWLQTSDLAATVKALKISFFANFLKMAATVNINVPKLNLRKSIGPVDRISKAKVGCFFSTRRYKLDVSKRMGHACWLLGSSAHCNHQSLLISSHGFSWPSTMCQMAPSLRRIFVVLCITIRLRHYFAVLENVVNSTIYTGSMYGILTYICG